MESKKGALEQLSHWFTHLTVSECLLPATTEHNKYNAAFTYDLIRETETQLTRWRAATQNGEYL